jgi:hypothetical protein
MRILASLLASVAILAGCSTPRMMMDPSYQERPKLESSLFRGDQDFISEAAVQTILASKIQIPRNAKIAVFKYEGAEEERLAFTYYGYYYWRSESYMKLQQALIDTLQNLLLGSGRVSEATPLPSMLVPKQPSISMLRQAAVRLQAHLLLVFRTTSDVYYDFSLFSKDKIKAYSTCEVMLFDTRTGIVPFTTVVTRDLLTERLATEVDRDEAMKRAQKEASIIALAQLGSELAEFLKSAE